MRRQKMEKADTEMMNLQKVYEQINEPDAIEGISSRLRNWNVTQQRLDHKRNGRWSAALSWYEIELQNKPNDWRTHTELLMCLKDAGQFGKLTDHHVVA